MVDEPTTDPEPDPAHVRWSERPQRLGRRRVVQALALVAVLVVGYLGVTFVQVWHASDSNEEPHAGAIVVLGAAQYDGRPSPVLAARLQHALDLYRAGKAPLLVVTGGKEAGDRYTEAAAGYLWLRRRDVPDDAILQEVKGRDTWESLAAVARFLKPRDVNDVILVSDSTHSLRLDGVASEVGLDPHVSPERTIHHSARLEARTLVRETAAVSVGRLIGYRRLSSLVG